MLALNTMSPEFTAIFFIVALVGFVVAAVFSWPWRSWNFCVAVGLAAWMFVLAWNAVAAT